MERELGSFRIFGRGSGWGRGKLGSFRIFWCVGVSPTSVGVKYRGGRPAVCVSLLGSFCIICPDGSGEILNPNLEIRNKLEIRNAKLET